MIRDYIPALSSKHPPSFDVAAKLDEIIALLNSSESDMAAIVSGTATVATGGTSIAVALDASLDGTPAVAVLADSGTSALYVSACEWDGSGNLTITVDQDPTGANCDVFYIVDGRS
tara:strand:+ start:306 stop:653 length:348 start_codon:yes stop_codon:yes gene_type:complete